TAGVAAALLLATIAGYVKWREALPAQVTVRSNDPNLVVTLDGQLVVFTYLAYPAGVRPVHDGSTTVGVPPGRHRVWAMKDGKLLREEVFTVAAGEELT